MDQVTFLAGAGGPVVDGYAQVAAARGYFADAGIQVQAVAGSSGEATLTSLAKGRAELGVVDYAEVLLRAGTAMVDPVRCVAAIHPHTLLSIVALPAGGIAHPRDLGGRRLAQVPGSPHEELFPVYARTVGFDPTHTTWRKAPAQELSALLDSGAVDGLGQRVGTCAQPVGNQSMVILPYREVLPDLFGDVLVATETMLASRRDVVRRFTTALLCGLRFAVDQLQPAARVLHAAQPQVTVDGAAAQLALLRLYVDPRTPGQGMGRFDFSRIGRSIALMQACGVYHNPVMREQITDLDVVIR